MYKATVIEIFIASPNDIKEERKYVPSLLTKDIFLPANLLCYFFQTHRFPQVILIMNNIQNYFNLGD
jgi:hypothetical protein